MGFGVGVGVGVGVGAGVGVEGTSGAALGAVVGAVVTAGVAEGFGFGGVTVVLPPHPAATRTAKIIPEVAIRCIVIRMVLAGLASRAYGAMMSR